MRPSWTDPLNIDGYSVASFRTLGTAASPQNLMSLENPSGSAVIVIVYSLGVLWDSTAALATVAPSLNVSRSTALPTGGTTLTAVKDDTALAAAVAICRGGTASDGGAATAITATAGASMRTQLEGALVTAAGIALSGILPLIGPAFGLRNFVTLRANEALLVQGVTASAATTHLIGLVSWVEVPNV